MEDKILVRSTKKHSRPSVVFSAHVPGDLLKSIDKIVENTIRSRNDIVQICLKYVVENIEIKNG